MHLVKINGAPGKTETSTWLPNATHAVSKELEIRNTEGAIIPSGPQPASTEESETATQTDGEDEVALREAATGDAPRIDPVEEDVLASGAPVYEAPLPW